MSKIIRKMREEKKRNRHPRKYTVTCYPVVAEPTEFRITDIVHERGKGAPLAVFNIDGKKYHIAATEGVFVGETYQIGDNVELKTGNIMKIKNIPEGTAVNSVEKVYGDGGKYAFTAGGFCTIVNHRKETNESVLRLPCGSKRVVSSEVRAVIGIVSSAAITEKPLLKAATVYHLRKSRGQLFPRVRGVAMNPVDHPHGGGNHQHIGYPCTIARKAPYAQQVGLIAARSTGRKNSSKKNK